MTQIAFSGVGVDFVATVLFSGVTFTVAAGERRGGYAVPPRSGGVAEGRACDPARSRAMPVAVLGGGERGGLGLAGQLMSTAEVLLLDEPTNHLDLETTQWLEQYLKEIDKTV